MLSPQPASLQSPLHLPSITYIRTITPIIVKIRLLFIINPLAMMGTLIYFFTVRA